MLDWFSKELGRLQEVKRDERGFTLIELLVVIIIIGILAAIAIPVFLNQRQQAWDSAAQSNLRNAAAATACSGDNNGSYASCDETALGNYGFNADTNVSLNVTPAANEWSATASHNNSDTVFAFSTNTGQVQEQGGGDD